MRIGFQRDFGNASVVASSEPGSGHSPCRDHLPQPGRPAPARSNSCIGPRRRQQPEGVVHCPPSSRSPSRAGSSTSFPQLTRVLVGYADRVGGRADLPAGADQGGPERPGADPRPSAPGSGRRAWRCRCCPSSPRRSRPTRSRRCCPIARRWRRWSGRSAARKASGHAHWPYIGTMTRRRPDHPHRRCLRMTIHRAGPVRAVEDGTATHSAAKRTAVVACRRTVGRRAGCGRWLFAAL